MMAKKKSEIICAMCGKVIIGKDQTKNQERIIVEIIDDTRYTFDSID